MRIDRRFGILMLLAGIMAAPSAAQAEAIEGDLSLTMNVRPNCGDNLVNCTSLTAATALDFIAFTGTTSTPGVAGVEFVNSATGDFAIFEGVFGTIKDFSFSGLGTANFPVATILAWETIGDLTFDLLSVQVDTVSSTQLNLSGTGLFHLAGYDDTPGTFTLTANRSGTTFSASASKGTIPDGGSTAALLGGVLFAVGILRRRFS